MMQKLSIILLFLMSFNAFSMRSDLEKNVYQSEKMILKSLKRDQSEIDYSASRVHSNREHFTKNLISVLVTPQSQTINYTDDAINGNFDLTANSGLAATIEWSHHSYNKLQLITGIDIGLMDYKDNTTLTNKNIAFLSEKLFGFYAGLRYFLSDNWNLYTKFSLSQSHYINFRTIDSVSSPVLSRFTVPKFYLGAEGMLYQSDNWKFSVDSRILALTNLSKKLASFEVTQGFGFYADVAFKYWISSKFWMRGSLYMESLTTEVTGDGYTAKQGSSTPGVAIELGMRI
jgi:hypothetical protein